MGFSREREQQDINLFNLRATSVKIRVSKFSCSHTFEQNQVETNELNRQEKRKWEDKKYSNRLSLTFAFKLLKSLLTVSVLRIVRAWVYRCATRMRGVYMHVVVHTHAFGSKAV